MEQLSLFDDMPVISVTAPKEENYNAVCRMIGARNKSQTERAWCDYYATDPIAAEWLMRLIPLDRHIWECACGEGHLAEVFTRGGYDVYATDLVDRGYGIGGIDFLTQTEPFDGDIVTNPPYEYSQEFIEHGLSLIPEGHKVCVLLRLQFLEGKARKRFFEDNPPMYVFVSSSRIKHGINGDFTNANSMMAIAWYVWQKGYKGDTILKWFN